VDGEQQVGGAEQQSQGECVAASLLGGEQPPDRKAPRNMPADPAGTASVRDISVSAPSTVVKVAPYMLTAVRSGDLVCWLTSVPSAKPDRVLAATDSVKLACQKA
jgi:hypothetical protein